MIGNDICDEISEFFKKGKMFKKFKFIMIIFIFNFDILELVIDFRLIFCCGVLYKIITKIINNRLKDVFDFLVGFE